MHCTILQLTVTVQTEKSEMITWQKGKMANVRRRTIFEYYLPQQGYKLWNEQERERGKTHTHLHEQSLTKKEYGLRFEFILNSHNERTIVQDTTRCWIWINFLSADSLHKKLHSGKRIFERLTLHHLLRDQSVICPSQTTSERIFKPDLVQIFWGTSRRNMILSSALLHEMWRVSGWCFSGYRH